MIIDTAVHPQWKDGNDIRQYMREPWKGKPFAQAGRLLYPSPVGEFADLPGGSPVGADPGAAARWLFDECGTDIAVLLPRTRGMHPDVQLDSAICSATNDWLAATWLDAPEAEGRFRGTIRISPRDPRSAVAEIERWSDDPRMVQVGIPLQAQHPYGQNVYDAIWEAAASADLPVAVCMDAGAGIEFWPTPAGYVRYHSELAALAPLNFAYHLANLIAEGCFARWPRLRFFFADGGHDMLTALLYRLDMHWRSDRFEMPWSDTLPSDVLRAHVRFASRRIEGPDDDADGNAWREMGDGSWLITYGSRYPHWDIQTPDDAFPKAPDDARARMLAGNALEFYGRRLTTAMPASAQGASLDA